jgi:hypothetical protein
MTMLLSLFGDFVGFIQMYLCAKLKRGRFVMVNFVVNFIGLKVS